MTSLAETLANAPRFHSNSKMAITMAAVGVTRCAEFQRIAALPRRTETRDLRELITAAFKTEHGSMLLRQRQANSLTELFDYRGLFGMLPVGDGKTLLSLLAPMVMQAERPLLLVPASLKKKTIEFDIPFYQEHFRLPENLTIMSYAALSSERQAEVLYDLCPDLIICDEVHRLRNPKAARTRRFLRYFKHYPNTVLCALSGAMTKRSLKDFWHILKLCRPEHTCPLPLTWPRLSEWADAIDADVPDERRVAAGALLDFCEGDENVRQGFRRRLTETPGVIASTQSAFGDEPEPGIEIYEVDPGTPPVEITEAFERLRMTWTTPSGEEISDGMSIWRHASSLALGFYIRWIWPCGAHADATCPTTCDGRVPDIEWLQYRKTWHSFVRETLRKNRRGLDSTLQVANACEAGDYNSDEYRAWMTVTNRYGPTGPPTETVWISDWIIKDVARVAASMGPAVIWVLNPALGELIATEIGCEYYGAGDQGIITETQTCVASIRAHGEGKNLQTFSSNIFVSSPLGGTQWQQTVGRTHRPGQESDTVECRVYLHCKEMFENFHKSVKDAEYIEHTTGDPQKLLQATVDLLHTAHDAELLSTTNPLWGNGI